MKKIALFLSIAMLFTLGNAPFGGSDSEVTLNASQGPARRILKPPRTTAHASASSL